MSGSAEQHGRLHALDGLRATMMLLGVVFHSACSYMTVGLGKVWPYKDQYQSVFADFLVSFLHVFRTPIFFVLAGLFAALLYSRRGAKGLLNNRFQRIGIPFIVGLFVLFPITNFAFIFANVAAKVSIGDAWAAVWAAAQTSAVYLPTFTMHLWFLYYLLYFYVAAVVIAWACSHLPAGAKTAILDGYKALVARAVLRVVMLGTITALTLAPMGGYLATKTGLVPDAKIALAYGVFFAFGWLLYGRREMLTQFSNYAWSQTLGAFSLYLVVKYAAAPLFGADQYTGGALVMWSLAGGICAWMLFFGLTGLFLRYLDKPSAVVRYIVDGSYWVYLLHLPFLMFVVGALGGTDLPAGVKIAIVITSTAAVGFLTYDLFVRSTFIGRVLNGQKYPRVLTAGVHLPHTTVPHAG